MLTRNASLHRPRFQPKPLVVAIHLGMAGILSFGGITQATAQTAASSRQYDISAGPLDQALTRFAQQAGVAISVDAGQLKGLQTKGLRGSYGVDEGFTVLLRGSGYAIGKTNAGYVLAKAASPDTGSVKAGPTKRDASHADTVLTEIMVTATTRTATPLSKAPASVSMVTQDDFEEAQAATVSQVLKKLPNVEFGGGPRTNGEIPTIRGYSAPSIALLVDGARQNWGTNSSLRSSMYVDPYFIGTAEVLRGSASSLYGPGGNGGAMTFRTIAAADFLSPGENFGSSVKLGRTTADNAERFNARIYGRTDTVDGLLAVGRHDWGTTVRQGGGTSLNPNDGDATTALLKLGVNSPALRFDISHLRYDSANWENNNPQTDSALAGAPAVQLMHTSAQQTVLKAATRGGENDPALAITVYDNDTKVWGDKGSNNATQAATLWRTDTLGTSLQGSMVFGGNSLRQRLTAGIDYYKDRQTTASSYLLIAPPTASQQVTGIFVQNEISWGAWTLIPSLRDDKYVTKVASTGASTSANRVSPKVALSYQAAPSLTLYGSYGEAFRAPTINEMYTSLSTTAAFSNFQANPSLKPETNKTFEIGANWTARGLVKEGDALKLRANLFDGKANDLINSTVVGTFNRTAPFAGIGSILQSQNVTQAKRRGGEAELSYHLGMWQMGAAYSRLRVTDESNGNGLFSPPDKLALKVRHQMPGNGISVNWNTTGVAAQDYDATLTRRRPGYATHDVYMSWVPSGQRFKLDVGVTNLADKRYSAYQSSSVAAYTYQEGRSLKLALSADF